MSCTRRSRNKAPGVGVFVVLGFEIFVCVKQFINCDVTLGNAVYALTYLSSTNVFVLAAGMEIFKSSQKAHRKFEHFVKIHRGKAFDLERLV